MLITFYALFIVLLFFLYNLFKADIFYQFLFLNQSNQHHLFNNTIFEIILFK